MNPMSYSNLELFAECPPSHTASQFFNRYLTAFLPPYYSVIAKKLCRRGIDFLYLLSWDSARLMRELAIPERVGDVGNYSQNRSDGTLNGSSSRIGEVYRSTFLRTLAWFYAHRLINEEEFA